MAKKKVSNGKPKRKAKTVDPLKKSAARRAARVKRESVRVSNKRKPEKNKSSGGKNTRVKGHNKNSGNELDILNDLLLNQLRAKKKRRKKTKERLLDEGWENFEITDEVLDSEDDY